MKVKGYYNVDIKLRRLLSRIDNSKKLTPTNKKYLLNYYTHAEANVNIGKLRIVKTLTSLFLFAEELKKPFNKLTQQDYEQVLVKMKNERNWSDNNVAEYITILKAFTRSWNKGKINEELNGLKTRVKDKEINPSDLVTLKEIKILQEHCFTYRDKTLLLMLVQCGLRAGELLTIQIKNLRIQSEYPKHFDCEVEGKTGKRINTFTQAYPYLLEYLEKEHCYRNDPDSFLFYAQNSTGQVPMSVDVLRIQLSKIGRRAKVKKRVNPHAFRHYSATRDARNDWTEIQLRKKYGWSKTSKTPSRYVHLAKQDIKNKELEQAGYPVSKKNNKEKLILLHCSCGTPNPVTNDYCLKCQAPVSEKAIVEERESRLKYLTTDLMEQILVSKYGEDIRKIVREEIQKQKVEINSKFSQDFRIKRVQTNNKKESRQ